MHFIFMKEEKKFALVIQFQDIVIQFCNILIKNITNNNIYIIIIISLLLLLYYH